MYFKDIAPVRHVFRRLQREKAFEPKISMRLKPECSFAAAGAVRGAAALSSCSLQCVCVVFKKAACSLYQSPKVGPGVL